ncbi:paraquat-inducible protein A [Gluconobacter morbifer]|uniref:Paraquat-inducible protein A n=1 Tax=Gluconobacter morbifer G707 TaxID=1088869 RepID=G6XML7_9PROT|nr:paraquat-inducible protein A [Gluconobacter morbifer]EHH67115.1 paraquat-inducible protein A [Gluconobacter morbifer G707]
MSDRFHKRLWRNAVSFNQSQEPHASLHVVEGLRECPTCGLFQHVPRMQPGFLAECRRCGGRLARRRKTAVIAAPAAFCVASAALYLALLISSLMTLNVFGRERTVALISGPIELGHQGYGAIGLLVAVVTIGMPGAVIGLMGAILYGASRPHMPDWTPRLMTWYDRLRGWSMVEVYVLGVLVAYTKLVDLALVKLQPGVFLLGALMLTMAAVDSTFDEELIWRSRDIRQAMDDHHGQIRDVAHLDCRDDDMPPVEHMLSCHACHLVVAFDHPVPQEEDMGDCPRCDQILRRRKPQSLSSATCLLVASIVFYLPANLMPVMTYTRVGHGEPSTIIRGVIELWQAGMIPLSLLVLFASITVPVLKIVALTIMLITTRLRLDRHLGKLAKLYRLVVIIGRWSMIDVFMISILVAVVHFGFLANVTADPGMVCFALVVILTIFAADMFDPRGMWDAAGLNGAVPSAASGNRVPETPKGDGMPHSSSDNNDMEPERA